MNEKNNILTLGTGGKTLLVQSIERMRDVRSPPATQSGNAEGGSAAGEVTWRI